MDKINLKGKRAAIFGLPGGGKSNLACHIASKYGSLAFIYDVMHEFPPEQFDVYRPLDRYSVPECEKILRLVVKLHKHKLVIVDECNRFCPSKPAPLPAIFGEINDCCRHPEYGFTPIFIARRPVQLNQDLTELAHYLFIFGLKGKNDIDYLNGYVAGLGDIVMKLPKFHYVLVNENREFIVHKPVPLMDMKRPTASKQASEDTSGSGGTALQPQ